MPRPPEPAEPAQAPDALAGDPRVDELQFRLEHLEAAFEGLQDAMDRESRRREKQIHELMTSTEPGAMARALSDDARRRGV
jgi:hypothetical protein